MRGTVYGHATGGGSGSGKLRPVLGMVAFSIGLSLPFFLLALFPRFLETLPRSGEWLARVEVVMGFGVLAAMLKYLYNVDEVLHIELLTRERFLAVWVVLLAMTGLYSLVYLRLPGISSDVEVSTARLLIGILCVASGLSLIPGMFGARLGEIETYVPPPESSLFGGAGSGDSRQLSWLENDLDGAFAKAREKNEKVLVDFTGDACTNRKWMKANMFTRPEISSVMKNMVLVELYTDRSDAAAQTFQKLEEDQFKTVAIPYYVLYDSNRNVLSTFPDRTTDSKKYLSFLNTPDRSSGMWGAQGIPDSGHSRSGARLSSSVQGRPIAKPNECYLQTFSSLRRCPNPTRPIPFDSLRAECNDRLRSSALI